MDYIIVLACIVEYWIGVSLSEPHIDWHNGPRHGEIYLCMWHAGCDCPPNVPENTPIQSITHGQPGQRSHDNSGRQSIERPDLISCNNSSTVYVAYSGVHYLELPEVHFRYSRTQMLHTSVAEHPASICDTLPAES